MTPIEFIKNDASRQGNVKSINQIGDNFVILIELFHPAGEEKPWAILLGHMMGDQDLTYRTGFYDLDEDQALETFQKFSKGEKNAAPR